MCIDCECNNNETHPGGAGASFRPLFEGHSLCVPCLIRHSGARSASFSFLYAFFCGSKIHFVTSFFTSAHSLLLVSPRAPSPPHLSSAIAPSTQWHFFKACVSTGTLRVAAFLQTSLSSSVPLSHMAPTTFPPSIQNAHSFGAKSPTTTTSAVSLANPQNAQFSALAWSFCSNTRE